LRGPRERGLIESLTTRQFEAGAEAFADIGVYDVDLRTREVTGSDALFRIAGLPARRDPMSTEAALAMFHPDDQDRLQIAGRQAIAEGSADLEARILRPGGDVRRLFIRITVVRDDNGDPARIVGVVVDLTRMHELESSRSLSDARFRALAQATGQIIWIGAADGTPIDVSSNWETITGHPLDVIFDRRFWDYVHLNDLSWLKVRRTEALEAGVPFEGEFRFQHAHGHYLVLRARSVSARDRDGRIVERVGTFTDVTSIREAERRKAESDKRFSDTFHTSRLPMLIRRVEDFRLMDVNDAFLGMSRHTRDEIIGTRIEDAPWFEDPDYASGFVGTFLIEGRVKQRPATLTTREGQRVPVVVWGEPIDVASERCVLISFEDISHQAAAEEARRASEELFYKAFHAGPVPQAIRDAETLALVEVNQTWIDYTGFSREEVVGKAPHEMPFVPGANIEQVHEAIALFRRDGRIRNFELDAIRKDRTPLACLVSVDTVAVGGRPRALVSLIDMTERKQAETRLRHSQKLEAVGQLAGGIAHDFNNLLTVINGYCDRMGASIERSNPLRQELDLIQRAGQRAAALTRQLLAFSRRQVLQMEVLDLNAVVRDMEMMLGRLLGEHVVIETRLGTDLGAVRADPGQIEQVIINLSINARDAMPDGGTLTFETANVELTSADEAQAGLRAGAYVSLVIRDGGSGMDGSTLAHVFEPFYTTKETGKGTGLGLPTVYGIVTQSGGTVTIESELGKGTTVRVLLPRVDAGVAAARPPAPAATVARGRETVLLVEDEELVRELVHDFLVSAGYDVLQAQDAEKAISIARSAGPSIAAVVTDVVLPGMNGSDLAEKLRELSPHIRVLYVSGYPGAGVFDKAAFGAGSDFLSKPFTRQMLTQKLRDMLDAPAGT